MSIKIKDINWRAHLPRLLLFAVTLVFLFGATVAHFQAQQELAAAEMNYRQQQSINRDAAAALAVFDEYIEPFEELQRVGIIGQPQRLQWIETLKQQGDKYRIPELRFTLEGSEMASQTSTHYWSETVGLLTTSMEIDFALSHEGDLVRLLNGLRNEALGVFSVEECRVQRLDNRQSATKTLVGFEGKCRLLWYSVNDITAEWAALPEEIEP